ncbi:Fe2+-dicitrate sensor protein [Comamonas sp. Tr-654]|uniref:FecR family protein n=1 Tax=Comamonas sp. Tr-654 TaxID=2608341 RepID=UPI00142189A8|nr:FecR domain-containing protein [Comamonas sp. Tr-654]NIF86574.1 Fe2+-dicitrate sensor protein [Comamonas sp. Tr-654]
MTDRTIAQPLNSDLDAEALEWFARYSDAPDAAYSDPAFCNWLTGHPDREAAFSRWQADWRQLDALPQSGIERLRLQLKKDQAESSRKSRTSKRKPSRWSALIPQAALSAILMALVVGGGYKAWDHWQQQPLFAQMYQSERGQQLSVQLPDGSLLRLDTATRVEVSFYRQRREVKLPQGQAVFEVQKNVDRPFDVIAGNTKVTVVGTRFSVRNTAGSPVQVAVEEGKVRVSPLQSDGSSRPGAADVLLMAGQQMAAAADGPWGPVRAVAASGIAPWRDGRITLENVPLSEALAEFERYAPTRMVVRDAAVGALRLSGTFDPQRLAHFRYALPKVLPVRLKENGDVTEIVARH